MTPDHRQQADSTLSPSASSDGMLPQQSEPVKALPLTTQDSQVKMAQDTIQILKDNVRALELSGEGQSNTSNADMTDQSQQATTTSQHWLARRGWQWWCCGCGGVIED